MDKRRIIACAICGSLACAAMGHTTQVNKTMPYEPDYAPGLNSVLWSTGTAATAGPTGGTLMFDYPHFVHYSPVEITLQDIQKPNVPQSVEENVLRPGHPGDVGQV